MGIAGAICLVILVSQVITGWYGVRTAYKRMPPVVDPERRTEPIGEAPDESLDLTALAGLPDDYRQIVVKYVESALDQLQTAPLMRERYYHVDRSGGNGDRRFPDDANPMLDRTVPVSLLILPRPESVRNWVKSTQARKAGWRSMDDALSDPGTVHGRTLFFAAGERSEDPDGLPAAPMGTLIPSWSQYAAALDSHRSFFLPLGKIVLEPFFNGADNLLLDGSRYLRLGEVGGAKHLGELLTVPLHLENQRLGWASRKVGSSTEQFLAYAVIDGNGARRIRLNQTFQMSDLGEVSPYLRPLICEGHQPRINQHDLLLLPVPIGWPPSSRHRVRTQHPHEEWSFDDWFPAQQDACWVIRETAESSPLKEAFVLMPAREESELPAFLIVLFAETEPAHLVRELASLYKVSAESLLTSEEKMGHLRHLYERVSTFRFD
ncbi:MAG: hypothetical protein WKF77_10550 [Planctomycetaceae bacterium]